MRPALTAAVALTAAALGACGGAPGDLIAIEVSGGPAGRDQRIVVADNGHASCNGGETRDIGSDALITARELARELTGLADRAAVYHSTATDPTDYTARTKDGTVRWQEGAAGLPDVLPRTQLFALEQGRALC